MAPSRIRGGAMDSNLAAIPRHFRWRTAPPRRVPVPAERTPVRPGCRRHGPSFMALTGSTAVGRAS